MHDKTRSKSKGKLATWHQNARVWVGIFLGVEAGL